MTRAWRRQRAPAEDRRGASGVETEHESKLASRSRANYPDAAVRHYRQPWTRWTVSPPSPGSRPSFSTWTEHLRRSLPTRRTPSSPSRRASNCGDSRRSSRRSIACVREAALDAGRAPTRVIVGVREARPTSASTPPGSSNRHVRRMSAPESASTVLSREDVVVDASTSRDLAPRRSTIDRATTLAGRAEPREERRPARRGPRRADPHPLGPRRAARLAARRESRS